jgi:hypothetical protein
MDETPAFLPEPVKKDVWIYRMVVGALALVALVTVLGGIGLAFTGGEIPSSVIALGSAAIGALAGLLAPSPS